MMASSMDSAPDQSLLKIPEDIVAKLLSLRGLNEDSVLKAARSLCKKYGRGCLVIAFLSEADLRSVNPVAGALLGGAFALRKKKQIWEDVLAYATYDTNDGFGNTLDSHNVVVDAVRSYDMNTSAVLAVLASKSPCSPNMTSVVCNFIGTRLMRYMSEKLEKKEMSAKSLLSMAPALAEGCAESNSRAEETWHALRNTHLQMHVEQERSMYSEAEILVRTFIPEELPGLAPTAEACSALEKKRQELLASAKRLLEEHRASLPSGNSGSNQGAALKIMSMMGGSQALEELHAVFGSAEAYKDAIHQCASAQSFMGRLQAGMEGSMKIEGNWRSSVQSLRAVCQVCGDKTVTACTGCRRVFYCSRTCQRKDWKSHKMDCEASLQKDARREAVQKTSANGTDASVKNPSPKQQQEVLNDIAAQHSNNAQVDGAQETNVRHEIDDEGAKNMLNKLQACVKADQDWSDGYNLVQRPLPQGCEGMYAMLWHVDQNVCAGNSELSEYAKNAMAFITQKPDQKHTLPLDDPTLDARVSNFLKTFRDA